MALKEYFSQLRNERAEAVTKIINATKKSPACVSRWISGESKPDYANAQLIAIALGIELEVIYEQDEESKDGKQG